MKRSFVFNINVASFIITLALLVGFSIYYFSAKNFPAGFMSILSFYYCYLLLKNYQRNAKLEKLIKELKEKL